jgi:hypothetical protein
VSENLPSIPALMKAQFQSAVGSLRRRLGGGPVASLLSVYKVA